MRTPSPTPALPVVAFGAGAPATGAGKKPTNRPMMGALLQLRSVPAADHVVTQLTTGPTAPNPPRPLEGCCAAQPNKASPTLETDADALGAIVQHLIG